MLKDPFGRTVDYLRLSVTDRCDLRCTYCMPERFKDFELPEHWLTFEEISRLVRAFALLGLKRVRITGGEPLLRKGLEDLVQDLSSIPGIDDLSLSTNGTQLHRASHALRAAGLKRLNVSLDSLNAGTSAAISRRDVLPQVLAGLEAAKEAGFESIKINTVLTHHQHREDIENLVEYCRDRDFTLRLIERMPMGDAGRSAPTISLTGLQAHLRMRYELVDGIVAGGGPARYLVSSDGRIRIGFITPLSQHFCATCNRVRMTVDGVLYPCLGDENSTPIREHLRQGGSITELALILKAAIAKKPERHTFNETPTKVMRVMAKTGG